MKKIKKTKIIATIGPSSSSSKTVEQMMLEGVDVFRINFSHAKHNEVKKTIKLIREIDKKLSLNTAIIADLQGPKLRIGKMKKNSSFNKGDKITINSKSQLVGNSKKLYVNYKNLAKDIKEGENILLDDGKIILKVLSRNKIDLITAEVIQGGNIDSNKGFNLPNTKISLSPLTEKDIEDAILAIKEKVDWLALSFVRSKSDIEDLLKIIDQNSEYRIPVIAKIEKPEALKNIDEIIKVSSGLMVARGDLGVEIQASEIPLIQKKLVAKAKKARIPVIIATQMMESMMESMSPTRAEVNDVANSVMDGADAVMLSGETSVGKYPLEVIKTISSIINKVENSNLISLANKRPKNKKSKRYITKSICFSAAKMANEIKAKAISTLTHSGYTAFQISSWRPSTHVLVFTSNKRILTQLNLLWGVKAFFYDGFESTDRTVEQINRIALDNKFLQKGDKVINLTSMPIDKKGMTNTLRISEI
jgi:pyruvate kinase|tara:strand:+ start:6315 stop:7745 length:1431 start_codon:yes stop_codon:yes gene_type:complete